MSVENKIKTLRERKNLKQIDISKHLNISKSTYSRYENGSRTPDYETLKNIAKFYNVSIDYILDFNNINEKVKDDKQSKEEFLKQELDKIGIDLNNKKTSTMY